MIAEIKQALTDFDENKATAITAYVVLAYVVLRLMSKVFSGAGRIVEGVHVRYDRLFASLEKALESANKELVAEKARANELARENAMLRAKLYERTGPGDRTS